MAAKLTYKSIYKSKTPEGFSICVAALYELLKERDISTESISHLNMPTYEEHTRFVERKPYKNWYLILDDTGWFVGAYYISHKDEIGIAISRRERGKGYAKATLKHIQAMHPEAVYANINPANEKSKKLFTSAGFRLIQETYKLR